MNVDYRSLVSRADLDCNEPVSRSEEGMPVGNGRMGSLVWTTPTALKFQINRVDVFAQNCETDSEHCSECSQDCDTQAEHGASCYRCESDSQEETCHDWGFCIGSSCSQCQIDDPHDCGEKKFGACNYSIKDCGNLIDDGQCGETI